MSNSAFYIAAQAGCVPMAQGSPGCGKTASVTAFARALRRPIEVIIGGMMEPADVGGYPYPDAATHVMNMLPGAWISRINKEPSVLFFDELTNCPHAVQAAQLRVINERRVGEIEIRPETIICAACNPVGQAANGVELSPPMANRLVHLNWSIDWEVWRKGLMQGLNFDDPSFPILPDNWQETHLTPVASLVSAFQMRKPSLFDAFPVNEVSKQSGAWPSMRSWSMGIQCLAAAKACNAGEAVEQELLTGCVGAGAAIEFDEWRNSLDLPDPRQVIDWAKASKKGKKLPWPGKEGKKSHEYVHPDRADKAIALLTQVVGCGLQEKTKESVDAAVLILEHASHHSMEIAIMCFSPVLAAAVSEVKADWGGAFCVRVGMVLQKVALDN